MKGGINHEPKTVVTAKLNIVVKNSGGRDGGSALKLAVKLPNCVISAVASSSGYVMFKDFERLLRGDLIPK